MNRVFELIFGGRNFYIFVFEIYGNIKCSKKIIVNLASKILHMIKLGLRKTAKKRIIILLNRAHFPFKTILLTGGRLY